MKTANDTAAHRELQAVYGLAEEPAICSLDIVPGLKQLRMTFVGNAEGRS